MMARSEEAPEDVITVNEEDPDADAGEEEEAFGEEAFGEDIGGGGDEGLEEESDSTDMRSSSEDRRSSESGKKGLERRNVH